MSSNELNDIVFIEGLAVETVIGVYDWERKIKQRLVFDISLQFDCAEAGRSDALDDALDYAAVSECVIGVAQENHFQLIEALAQKVADSILERFPIAGVRIRLSKPGAVPQAVNVGIEIVRGGWR